MATQSTRDDSHPTTNAFYRRTLHVLSDADVPFLAGGSHAFLHYTGIERNTKDFDLFLKREDMERALVALRDAGYRTDLTFPHWLGKGYQGDDHVDLIFNSGNGVCRVDESWFHHAEEAQVLGLPVKLMPAEELVWQKAFIMERERFDGADLMHIFRARGPQLDWHRLLERFDRYWPLLYTYVTMFAFVYPGERKQIPAEIWELLTKRFEQLLTDPTPADDEKLCQGTLVSRGQYMLDIGQYGYADARLAPRGSMSAEDVIFWTWAMANIH